MPPVLGESSGDEAVAEAQTHRLVLLAGAAVDGVDGGPAAHIDEQIPGLGVAADEELGRRPVGVISSGALARSRNRPTKLSATGRTVSGICPKDRSARATERPPRPTRTKASSTSRICTRTASPLPSSRGTSTVWTGRSLIAASDVGEAKIVGRRIHRPSRVRGRITPAGGCGRVVLRTL
ncbi:hypothetical protein GCM10009601_14120 [Streptomyces thermospinosisporus]|uniref:Uncharacterized protein n=1 Tax=Streptomyces thermospinosisporus TaxID=161482 RepID=A0ABN1YQ77_9ACTN